MKSIRNFIFENSIEIKHQRLQGSGRFYYDKGDLTYEDEIVIYPKYHENCFELTNLEAFEKNKGIGSLLLKKMIEYAKDQNKDIVLYASPLDNRAEDELINFYKKFGFVEDEKANDKHCLIYKINK